uniref:Uncharacterized protein n=1 Tax=Lygus hesperus TaxID=30085 RepID=A0A146LVF7_LYGHE
MMIVLNMQLLPACLLLFAVCLGVILYLFTFYEIYYALCNLTMNDMNKIDDVVMYVTELNTCEEVYAEAVRIRARLEAIACRTPTKLKELQPPVILHELDGETEKNYRYRVQKYYYKYRKQVAKMLTHDLKGLYDKG